MVRLGRGFPQSSTQLGFAAIDFIQIIVVLDNGRQTMTTVARNFASVDINDTISTILDITRQTMTGVVRNFVLDIDSEFTLVRTNPMTMVARNFDVLGISPPPGWTIRDLNRKNEKSRQHAFNRMQHFDDTTGEPGLDFAPIISQFGFWRVSTTLRDTIALKSRFLISESLEEGKP